MVALVDVAAEGAGVGILEHERLAGVDDPRVARSRRGLVGPHLLEPTADDLGAVAREVHRRRVHVLDLEVDDPPRGVADRPVDPDAVEHRVERADEALELRLRDLLDALRGRADEVAQRHEERALRTPERLRFRPRHHERADPGNRHRGPRQVPRRCGRSPRARGIA